jgi:hypothetical protein
MPERQPLRARPFFGWSRRTGDLAATSLRLKQRSGVVAVAGVVACTDGKVK